MHTRRSKLQVSKWQITEKKINRTLIWWIAENSNPSAALERVGQNEPQLFFVSSRTTTGGTNTHAGPELYQHKESIVNLKRRYSEILRLMTYVTTIQIPVKLVRKLKYATNRYQYFV